MKLLSHVEETIKKYKMLKPGEPLLVACSGGADSVVLFHLLRELRPEWRIKLTVIHFDHNLRAQSARDFKFVQSLAKRFKIPIYHDERRGDFLGNGLSPEEAARKIRYEFFEKAAKKTGIKKIALGHQQNDQAETLLMRLVQGTGLRGLQGIRPVIKEKGITYIRPLLSTNRKEIRTYLKEHSYAYREDATNRSKRFLRNQIRHDLLPFLEKKFNPQIRTALCRLAETIYQEFAGMDEWVREQGKAFLKTRRKDTFWLDRENFLRLPSMLQFRLLDQFLHDLDSRSGLDFESWSRIEEGFRKARFRITLPRNVDLHLSKEKLFIKKNLPYGHGLRLRSKK